MEPDPVGGQAAGNEGRIRRLKTNRRFKVGVQIHPQQTTMQDMRDAWSRADRLGVDTIFTWDHFFPQYGDPQGPHFEAMTLLAAMAVETSRAMFGALVTANSFRNPNLVADMARTIDHLSGGRFIFGIGAGFFEREYREYGFDFGTAMERLMALDRNLPTIKDRLAHLNPKPLGPMPIMVGGSGERVTLRIVAQHANMWNTGGPPEVYARKCQVLRRWCDDLGRDFHDIERTVRISEDEVDGVERYLDAGAQHVIVELAHPFDLGPATRLLALARQ